VECPSAVPTHFTPSGHILVRPTVNGRDGGWMLLDTGTGGMAIEAADAAAAGLQAFGRFQVSTVHASLPSRYWRARSVQLGPLLMHPCARSIVCPLACRTVRSEGPLPFEHVVPAFLSTGRAAVNSRQAVRSSRCCASCGCCALHVCLLLCGKTCCMGSMHVRGAFLELVAIDEATETRIGIRRGLKDL
jgi:hypothetical protein